MKKTVFFTFVVLFAITTKVTSQENPKIKFIKGNIQDKIESVKEDAKDNVYEIAESGIDFVYENLELLRDDRDFAALAVASIYSYPEKAFLENSNDILYKLSSIYYSISDKNVKLSVLDKLYNVYQIVPNSEYISFINNYIDTVATDNVKFSDIEEKAIQILSKIGNETSFKILYSIYMKNVYSAESQNQIKDALISLVDKGDNTLIEIIQNADFDEMKQIYSVFIDNSKLSLSKKAEIAENLLSKSMINVKETSVITKEQAAFKFKLCSVLNESNWTRSYALIISYFDIAKFEYNHLLISGDEFEKVISFVEKTSSNDAVKVLSAYLEELNMEMENNNLPAVNVVSAVIQALGNLGDKSAFDSLLFATYLNYPDDIVAQARRALSSLKW